MPRRPSFGVALRLFQSELVRGRSPPWLTGRLEDLTASVKPMSTDPDSTLLGQRWRANERRRRR